MFTTIVPIYEPNDVENLLSNLEMIEAFSEEYHLKVIIIDDGSKCNDYIEKLKSFESIHFLRNERNLGKAASINKVIPFVDTDYINILDVDDRLCHLGIVEKLEFIEKENKDLLIGSFQVVNQGEVHESRLVPDKTKKELIEQFLAGFKTPFHLNATLFKKNIFVKVGGMDKHLRRAQDTDLAVKILKGCSSYKLSETIHYKYIKHRDDLKSILELRLKTIAYRNKMISNNSNGIKKYYFSGKAFIIDVLKLFYSMGTKY